jgi:glycosyltransferase involved in cell wall biosynthesis
LYIVASREEGGPKAVFESMASGIPLVTTRVGQAMDMVIHKENALMVESEDSEGLAFWGGNVLSDTQLRDKIVKKGLITAGKNTYQAHVPLWKEFFEGFVQTN